MISSNDGSKDLQDAPKKKSYGIIIISIFFFIILLTGAVIFIWRSRGAILEKQLETLLNRSTQAHFKSTLDLEGVNIDPGLKVSVRKLTGTWQSAGGSFPFEVHGLLLKNSATDLLRRRPSQIVFQHLRSRDSTRKGVLGELILNQGAPGSFGLKANVVELNLEEITALDPVNLEDTSGKLTGTISIKANAAGPQEFKIKVKAAEPGGRLQAKFFNLLLPYLPLAERKTLILINQAKTVHYTEADLWAELDSPQAIKLLLHIKVPDYNLNLNLNMKVRLEHEVSFLELARLTGLLKAKQS